jgi:hypothetical protein
MAVAVKGSFATSPAPLKRVGAWGSLHSTQVAAPHLTQSADANHPRENPAISVDR